MKKITNRELQVLKLAALETEEIASILNISKNTVKELMHRVCLKLSVKNRRQAIVKTIRLGLVEANNFIVGFER